MVLRSIRSSTESITDSDIFDKLSLTSLRGLLGSQTLADTVVVGNTQTSIMAVTHNMYNVIVGVLVLVRRNEDDVMVKERVLGYDNEGVNSRITSLVGWLMLFGEWLLDIF